MGRPKKAKYQMEERFLQEALRLAESYSDLLEERKNAELAVHREIVFTKGMAIEELLCGRSSSDSERVQNSNISNQPQRIAILLANGYVEKRQQELETERLELLGRIQELSEQIDIVETAVAERMDARTKAVFVQIWIEKRKKSMVVDEQHHLLYRQQVERSLTNAVRKIAEEMAYQEFVENCERKEFKWNGQTEEENICSE